MKNAQFIETIAHLHLHVCKAEATLPTYILQRSDDNFCSFEIAVLDVALQQGKKLGTLGTLFVQCT